MRPTVLPPGTRVHADGKPGVIKYVRMSPPTYREAHSYSVVLDALNGRSGYEGSIFAASAVSAVTSDTALVDTAAAAEKYRENRERS